MDYSNTTLTDKDEKLLRYCKLHCQTDRALFSRKDCGRLIELMGEKNYNYSKLPFFVSIHDEEMEEIIKKIKVRNSKNK